ncbi:hypothetical protein HELRODRAFT_67965 [Helobdella robusta]|uniref:EF-hand domain-containing protein n=1 Tax=Helobdella robusta TaxID=6412 RepID=T1FZ87_HELRO|nr:hypothetical protein HELRODRAFT_67965 [Helobdella robusta]ESN96240.1 hypothetical protein HELRODRAFT_67965 [Helobdella robusta]
MSNFGYPGPGGGYPPQQPGGYPQQPGGYPQQPGGYPQQPGGYPQQPGSYPNQPAGGQAGGYQAGGFGFNPPQNPSKPVNPAVPPQGQNWGGGVGGNAPSGVDPNVFQWFQAVDRDRTGKINANELQMALTNANWSKFNLDTCRLMITMFDRDKSGQIDINEFQGLWTYIHQWKTIFDQFDRDRSGTIDGNELHSAYLQMGYRLSPQFSQSVVYRFDMSGQQRISLDYFIHSCILIKNITEQFRARDTANSGFVQIGYEDFVSAVVLNKI